MCFARKPWLGCYNATREEWGKAYRAARIARREGCEPDPSLSGIAWKATLIITGDRERHDDLSVPIFGRLLVFKMCSQLED